MLHPYSAFALKLTAGVVTELKSVKKEKTERVSQRRVFLKKQEAAVSGYLKEEEQQPKFCAK